LCQLRELIQSIHKTQLTEIMVSDEWSLTWDHGFPDAKYMHRPTPWQSVSDVLATNPDSPPMMDWKWSVVMMVRSAVWWLIEKFDAIIDGRCHNGRREVRVNIILILINNLISLFCNYVISFCPFEKMTPSQFEF
jgi:hypothetical protein